MPEFAVTSCPPYEAGTTTDVKRASATMTALPQTQSPISPAMAASGHHQYIAVQPLDRQVYYQAPTPIHDLGHLDALVDCPYCGATGRTKTSLSSGNMNHVWAGCLFFTTVIFTCVPYMISGLKNVNHRCRSCDRLLATWHRSGHTQSK